MQIPTLHIVDDDQAVRESLRALLESYQFQVQDYSSGAEFVHRCSSGVKGCVILDMHLPAMDGLQILEYLRDGMRCDAPRCGHHGCRRSAHQRSRISGRRNVLF